MSRSRDEPTRKCANHSPLFLDLCRPLSRSPFSHPSTQPAYQKAIIWQRPTHRHTHKSLAVINMSPPTSPSITRFTDILSFCFSILSLYGLVFYLRFLIPRNLLPCVSAVLTEAEHLLDRAESLRVIPQPNDHRSALTLYEAVVTLLTDRHLTDDIVALVNSCRFGWKAVERLEYCGNSGLLFGTV